jgi:hypothetical protein
MDLSPSDRALHQTPPLAVRHPFLIHGLLALLCWCDYGFDHVDVVWRIIRNCEDARRLEHLGFGLSAVLIGLGVWLGAWPSGRRASLAAASPNDLRRRCVGEMLHAAGIASLLPAAGALLLIVGETIRSARYAQWRINAAMNLPVLTTGPSNATIPRQSLQYLLRHIAGVCAFLSMLAFSITLRDSQADVLFAATALVFIVSRFIDEPRAQPPGDPSRQAPAP